MRALFATGSPPRYMLPPELGDEQVNCGPTWPDEVAPDGRVISLATPLGEYDLAAVAARLPPEQKPEAVVCLVDASWRNLPRNLANFHCPRVLLVADTHHLQSPIIGMLRYAAAEAYDRIIFLYDRHHAAFFHAAGLTNLFWFPGLTFPHSDAEVHAARLGKRESRIAFVGQLGRFHPRRSRMCEILTAHKLPFVQKQLSQSEGLKFYGSSSVGLNVSLNSDLNLRVFELLASGAALLTDRLAPSAGLNDLLAEGREYFTYDDSDELVERATHLIHNPRDASQTAECGARWFDAHMSEATRRTSFQRLVSDGTPAFPLPFATHQTEFFNGDTDRLLQALIAYENVQEMHRTQENVTVSLRIEDCADFGRICGSLPRIRLVSDQQGGDADFAVASSEAIYRCGPQSARKLWIWDARADDRESIATHLAGTGYTAASEDISLFRKPDAPTDYRQLLQAAANTREPSKLRPLLHRIIDDKSLDNATATLHLLAAFAAPLSSRHEFKESIKQSTCLAAFQSWFAFDYVKVTKLALQADILLPFIAAPRTNPKITLSGLSLKTFRTYTYCGFLLWPICQYTVSYDLGVMPEEVGESPTHNEVIQRVFAAATILLEQILSAIAFYRPHSVIYAQGYELQGAVLRHVAVAQGLRAVALENVFRKDRLLWDDTSGISVNRNLARNYFWRYAETLATEESATTVANYLSMIGTLKSQEHFSPRGVGLPESSAGDLPILVYLAQVGIDSSVLFGRQGFRNQAEIISALATYAVANNCRLVVKLHPKESAGYKFSQPAFCRYTARSLACDNRIHQLREQMRDRLLIDEDNRLNTYELIRRATVCITLNSQSGLEALAMGKEVIVCGQAFFGGLGFTHEAQDEPALCFVLDRVLAGGLRRNDSALVARFFHVYTELYCVPKTEDSFVALAAGRPVYPPPVATTAGKVP